MFRRRKEGKSTGPWYYWHPVTGKRTTTGTKDRALAKAIIAKAERESIERNAGIFVPLFTEQTKTWLELNQALVSYDNQEDYAQFWNQHLKGYRLGEITADIVHNVIKRERPINMRQGTKENATANKYAEFVGKIVRSAGVTPPKFHVYPQSRKAKRWLLPGEWRSLRDQMRADLQHISTFSIATGLREANVMRFEWAWLHGNSAFLPPEVTKTNAAYGIPLNQAALKMIEARKAHPIRHKDFVFLNNGRPWNKSMYLDGVKRAAASAGLEGVAVHTFRHTFASWLAQSAVPDSIRRRLGCWSLGGSADAAYLHFDVEWLRAFSEKLDPLLLTSVSPELQVVDIRAVKAQ